MNGEIVNLHLSNWKCQIRTSQVRELLCKKQNANGEGNKERIKQIIRQK